MTAHGPCGIGNSMRRLLLTGSNWSQGRSTGPRQPVRSSTELRRHKARSAKFVPGSRASPFPCQGRAGGGKEDGPPPSEGDMTPKLLHGIKTLGYLVSSLSVFLLAIVSWDSAQKSAVLMACLLAARRHRSSAWPAAGCPMKSKNVSRNSPKATGAAMPARQARHREENRRRAAA